MKVVDLFTGEHLQPAYAAINPNKLVPVLDDGNFRLTESSAIIKYLADKVNSPLYPKDLQQRARVNERMDWVNTQLARDLAHGFVYPQVFPTHKRRSDEATAATVALGKERTQAWLQVMNDHLLTPDGFLCGPSMTIADFFAASFVALTELTGSDLAPYPNVKRWLGKMKALKHWKSVNEAIDGFGASLKGQPMQTV